MRLAQDSDFLTLEQLIPLSFRALQAPFYSSAQMEAAIGPVFGGDRLGAEAAGARSQTPFPAPEVRQTLTHSVSCGLALRGFKAPEERQTLFCRSSGARSSHAPTPGSRPGLLSAAAPQLD
jgi:hypothetical protein